MRKIASFDELKRLAGQEVASSAWIDIPQERINLFADATEDHQWIHVDPARAAIESPFGRTVAHGFLTLSLLPRLMATALELPPRRLAVNYGLNKVRFPAPVPAGSKVRAHISVLRIEDITAGAQVTWGVTVECDGSDKPVCIAESITRVYF